MAPLAAEPPVIVPLKTQPLMAMSLLVPWPRMPPMCVLPLTLAVATQFRMLLPVPCAKPTMAAACMSPVMVPPTVRSLMVAPLM